jgi:hypothetical protein
MRTVADLPIESVPERSGFWLRVERYGPLVLTTATLLALYIRAPSIYASMEAAKWQISNLYAAVFNWSAIQTGFAFAVYGFVAGRTQGFVEAMRETVALKRFIGYVKRANVGGFVLTIVTLPLTVLSPAPGQIGSAQFFMVLAWFGLFLWTFFAFLRIAYGFGHLSSVRDQPAFYGA